MVDARLDSDLSSTGAGVEPLANALPDAIIEPPAISEPTSAPLCQPASASTATLGLALDTFDIDGDDL